MALDNFQYSYNGLTFGAGTDIQIVSEQGLRSIPEVRTQDAVIPRNDGTFAGLNFLGGRTAVLTLAVTVTKELPFETVVSNIANAFQSISDPTQQQVLQFMYPGWSAPRQLTGRVTKAGFPTDLNYSFHKIVSLPVEFVFNDPLIYDSVPYSVTAGLPSPTAGLTFNVTFNATFGSSVGGSLAVTNLGNIATPPVITIQGPMLNPRIALPTGEYMQLDISLGSTDTVVIDMKAHTIVLNGTASRVNTMRVGSSWFFLPVGTSSLSLSSQDSTQVVGTFTVAWRSAWSWC